MPSARYNPVCDRSRGAAPDAVVIDGNVTVKGDMTGPVSAPVCDRLPTSSPCSVRVISVIFFMFFLIKYTSIY